MTIPDINAPAVGEHGAPCPTCAAPLASDQRYCLSCGTRRAEARLPFREILATAASIGEDPAVAPARPRGAPHEHDDGSRPALLALGAIACLLLALGVGVLIGGSGSSDATSQVPAPQVITVGGATGAAAAAPAGAAAGTGTTPTTPKVSKAAEKTATPAAQNPQIKKLEKLSPSDYQKQSQKLPKVVGTGGKAPPKDNKPAAGGGSFQTIG